MGKRIIPGSNNRSLRGFSLIVCQILSINSSSNMEISPENFYVENYPAERISLDKGKV